MTKYELQLTLPPEILSSSFVVGTTKRRCKSKEIVNKIANTYKLITICISTPSVILSSAWRDLKKWSSLGSEYFHHEISTLMATPRSKAALRRALSMTGQYSNLLLRLSRGEYSIKERYITSVALSIASKMASSSRVLPVAINSGGDVDK